MNLKIYFKLFAVLFISALLVSAVANASATGEVKRNFKTSGLPAKVSKAFGMAKENLLMPPLVLSVDSQCSTPCCNSVGGGTGICLTGVKVQGGTPPYSYAWSTGGTTPCIPIPGPGVYVVMVTDALGNSATLQIVVQPGVCCKLVCPNDTTICFDLPDSLVKLGKPKVVSTNPTQPDPCYADSIWNNATGVYPVGTTIITWYARYPDGHIDTCKQNIIRNLPINVNISFTTSPAAVAGVINICNGQSITFTNTSTGITGQLWNFGNGYYSSNPTYTQVYNFPPGTYTVTLTNYDACGNKYDTTLTVIVDPNSGPDIECISVVCPGDTVTYHTNANCTNYAWVVTGGVIISTPLNNDSITVVWGPGPAGTISLTVTGCTPPSTCAIATVKTVNIVPATLPVKGDTIVCSGSTSTYCVACIPGNVHTWTVLPVASYDSIKYNDCCVTIYWSKTFFGTVSVNVNYNNVLTGSGCNLPDGCPTDQGCGGTGNLTVVVRPIFGISGPIKVCPNSVSAPFNGMNLTNNTIAPGVSWKLKTPAPSTLTFANTALLNAYTWNAGIGIYTLTAYAPPGIYCNDSATINVEVVEIKVPNVITGPDTVCPGTTHFYNVQPNMSGVQYIWNVTGAGSPAGTTITSVPTLAVTWGAGGGTVSVQQQLLASPFCTSVSTAPFTVVTYPPFTLPVVTANPGGSSCLKSSVTYCYSGPPLSNATYLWSVVPPTAGNITTANGGNCITIQWTDGSITPIFVKLKISRCYEDSVMFPVTLLALPPVPSISYSPLVICKNTPVNFSTTSLGPVWNWNFGDLSPNSPLQNPTHTYTTAGNFTVSLTVTNSNGCSDTAFTNVVVEDVPVLPVITGNASACLNSFANYSFSQPFFSGASYNWSLSGGGNIISGQGSNSISVQWIAPGSHQVFLSVTSLCPPGAVIPFNVTVNPLPTVAITLPSPSCVGSALTFNSTGSPVTGYSWSFSGGSPSSSTVASPVVTYSVVGTYPVSLTVTDANGCTATALTSIDIHELPIAFITTPDADGCTFPYPVNIYAVNSGGYSFSWIPTGTTGPSLSTTVTATTTYSVLVTNQYGCTQMSNPITFTSGNCAPAPPQPGDCVTPDSINFTWNPPLCLQDSFFVSGSALPPYNWFFDYAGATATGSAVSNTYVYPGFYKVTVCGTGRGFIYPAMVAPCPNITICKMRPVKVPFDARFKVNYACAGNVMQTIITNTSIWAGANTYTWNWYLDGSGTPFSSVTNPPNQAISPGPHTITLIITDPGATLATCTLTVPINVPAPIVASFTSPAQICKGFAAAFLDTSTPAALTRLWTSAGAPSTTTNPANLIYTVAGATTVTLNVSDIYGCTSSASANVNVQQGTGTITVVNNGACDSVQLVASGNPNYIWTYFNPIPSVLSNTVYVKTGGYYSVVAIDPSNGCQYSASTPLITVLKPPVATITGKITYCQGDKLDLKTSSAGTVVWRYDFDSYVSIQGNLPNMNNVASLPGTFIYQVTVAGLNGCTATASITIVVDPVPGTAAIVGSPTSICQGDSVQLSVAPPGVTYLWSKSPPPPLSSPANASPSIWVTQSGTYSVIVQTSNGCYYPAIAPKTITVNPLPPVKISGDTVLCEGETLLLTTINVGGATYVWSGPGGGGASNPLQINNMLVSGSGVYTVTVNYTATGCSSTGTINVIVHPNPIVPIIASNVPGVLCEGALYTDSVTPPTIDGSLTPLQYVWNTGQQGYQILVAKAGDYFVTATNQWGCSSVSNVLTIHPTPDLSCVPTGCYDFCTECDTVEIPGPLGFASYQWQILSGGVFVNYSTTQNLKVFVPGGKFRLIAANIWGCADSSDTLDIKFHDCCTPVDTASCIDTTICQYFLDNSLHGFGPYAPQPNVAVTLSNVGGQFVGDKFVLATDQPGASAVKGGTDFNGKWCCGHFCYDFKIFNDGVNGSPNYSPSFKIYNGTLGFLFTSNVISNENNGWHRVNACVSKDSIPTNISQGVWTPIAPATAADWSLVAGNVTDVVFVTDFSGDNGEVSGIDNVCFYPEVFTVACAQIQTCGGTTVLVNVIDTADCPVFKYKWSNGATTPFLQSVPPGTYCVTVSNCCGCIDSCCVTVIGHPDTLHVTDTVYHITCDSIFGGIDVSVTGGVLPYTYEWSNGAQTQDVTGLVAGIYTLTVTDSVGCVVVIHDTVVIETNCNCNAIPPPPPPSITINSIVADSCNNSGCIHATFTGCCLRYSYTYYDPCNPGISFSVAQTTDSSIFCNLKAGTYTIYVQDPCGNIVSQTVVIPLVNGPLTVSVQYSNCADSICLNVEGGCPPYTYLWLGGATTQCITGFATCVDTYVTVTDSRGCSVVQFVTAPDISFPVVINPTCCYANGRICAEVCFGQQPYTYLWSNGATTSCINGLIAGTYCVTVTNANGATISCCYTLTAPVILPPAISFHFDQCGSMVTAVVNANGCPYTAYWENGTPGLTRDNLIECDSITLTVVMCDGTVYHHGCRVPHVTAVITPANCITGIGSICVNASCFGCGPLTYEWLGNAVCPSSNSNCFNCIAGFYKVCITNCQGDVVCCSYLIPATPVLSIALVSKVNPTSVFPASGAININVTGGTPAYTYLWSNGATTQNVSGLPAGNYTVTVTDANGCSASMTFVLKMQCKLSYTTIVVQPASCYLNNGIATVVPSGGTSYSYLWLTSPTQTTATATGLPYGASVTVIITDVSGCTLNASITVPTSLGLGVTLLKTNVSCNGGSDGTIVSTVSGSPGPYIYQWSNGATTANLSGLPAGTYTVTVTTGGCDAIASITITQPTAIVLSTSKNNPGCGLNNGSATVAASGGTPAYTYSWNTIPVQTNTTATGLAAGTYTVTVTDSKGCTKTKSVTLTGGSSLVITAIVSNVKCFGGSTGSIDITPSGGTPPYTYLWSTGATTQDRINILPVGTYTVTVTDKNGCTAQFSSIISQPPLLTVTASATNVSCFGGKNGTLSASAAGGTPPYSYSWNTVPAKTGSFVTGIKKGTYTVIVTDSKGCLAAATVTITEPPAIVISITKTNVSVAGGHDGTATANPSGGVSPYTYSWNTLPVQTGQTATGLYAGVYTVTVTDANGCTKTKSVTITQPILKAGTSGLPDEPYSNLFPNPTSGLTTIIFSEKIHAEVRIIITNMDGQRILEKTWKPHTESASFDVDLTAYPKGIYIVKYNTDDKSWIDKLVIQ